MRIGVIGAGVVGLSTAHALFERGYEVAVFEAHSTPGCEASYANGAQLSYSFTDPLASPGLLRSLPAIVCGRDPGVTIRHSISPKYIRWVAQFLVNCLPEKFRKNSNALERLADRSAELMQCWHQELGFDHRTNGKLVLLKDATRATAKRRLQSQQDLKVQIVTAAEARDIEPSLANWRVPFDAALYSPRDEVGDAHRFCVQLTEQLRNQGVHFEFDHRVSGVSGYNGGAVITSERSTTNLDAVVVCTGAALDELLNPIRVRHNVYPVAGYSLTMKPGAGPNKVNVTSLSERVVFSPVSGKLRIAGFVDVNGKLKDRKQQQARLLEVASRIAPEFGDYGDPDMQHWVGYRPMTPSSVPFVGPSSTKNVYLNVGHGMLGWTLSAATAEAVALAITNNSTSDRC